MLKFNLRIAAPVIAAACLSSCSMVPGMKMENPLYSENADVSVVNPAIVPITPAIVQQLAPELNPYVYRVGIGDQLSITVWGHPEFNSPAGAAINPVSSLNSQLPGLNVPAANNTGNTGATGYIVASDGTVFFPLIGNVQVAGLSIPQITALITQKLAYYVKDPQVIVQVNGFNSQRVYIMGELNQGQQPTALIPVTNTPMTLSYALATLGGINQNTADTSQIYVIRGSYTQPTIYWLNAESPAAMLYADNFPLQNHDVVFVSAAPVVRWNRLLNQILPTIQTIWYTKAVVNP